MRENGSFIFSDDDDPRIQAISHNLIDLYLSVKVRRNVDIDVIDSHQVSLERTKLLEQNISPETLCEYIKSSIETLMTIQGDGRKPLQC